MMIFACLIVELFVSLSCFFNFVMVCSTLGHANGSGAIVRMCVCVCVCENCVWAVGEISVVVCGVV